MEDTLLNYCFCFIGWIFIVGCGVSFISIVNCLFLFYISNYIKKIFNLSLIIIIIFVITNFIISNWFIIPDNLLILITLSLFTLLLFFIPFIIIIKDPRKYVYYFNIRPSKKLNPKAYSIYYLKTFLKCNTPKSILFKNLLFIYFVKKICNFKKIILSEGHINYEKLEKVKNIVAISNFNKSLRKFINNTISTFFQKEIKNNRAFKIIIRSSFDYEASKASSHSGIYSSYISDCTIDAILKNIKKTWISYFSKEAYEYRKRKKINKLDFNLELLFQEYLDSNIKGVIFTANPLTKRKYEMLIEAYDEETLKLQIIYNKITKEFIIKINQYNTMPFDFNNFIDEIVVTSTKIERFFLGPQDIEWIWYEDKLYILQVRPINIKDYLDTFTNTAIVDIPTHLYTPLQKSLQKYSSADIEEILLFPYRYLGIIEKSDQREIARFIDRKYFVNFDLYYMIDYFNSNIFNQVNIFKFISISFKLLTLFITAIISINYKIYFLLLFGSQGDFYSRLVNNIKNVYNYYPLKLSILVFLYKMFLPEGLSSQEGFVYFDKNLLKLIKIINKSNILREIFLNIDGADSPLEIIKTHLNNNKKLNSLFLRHYRECEIFYKNENDLYNFKREENFKEYVSYLKNMFLLYNKIISRESIIILKYFNKLRYLIRKQLLKESFILKNILIDIGDNLTKRGLLNKKDDIFWLEIIDILNLLKNKELVELSKKIENNKKLYYSTKKSENKKYLDFQGSYIIDIASEDKEIPQTNRMIKAIPCSPGKVTAKILYFNEESKNKLDNNSILVITRPNPYYVIYFSNVKGIICKTGGVLSHLAILAREFNLPAIFGAENIEAILKSGDTVFMDGDTGIIQHAKSGENIEDSKNGVMTPFVNGGQYKRNRHGYL